MSTKLTVDFYDDIINITAVSMEVNTQMPEFCFALIDDEYDRTNFKKLYDVYADDVFKRIYKLIQNQQDTEDIMQETWLAVAENIEFYRGKDDLSIRAYILRIAKNRAITFYHKKEREKSRRCQPDLEALNDNNESEDLLFRICNKTDVATICECIDSLNEIYSDVLTYYYLHDRSVKEIAKILSLKEATVRARLVRGRAKLLHMLEGRNLNDR